MNIQILNILDATNPTDERLVLKALSDLDIGLFSVVQARVGGRPNTVRSGPAPAAYWFANKEVKTGDLIVLYTKTGKLSEKKLENGTTSHFFYWRRSEALWTPGFIPVVLSIREYQIGEDQRDDTVADDPA